jgi:LAS superfamily LD-carboxypeptidase LdcB
MLTPQQLTGCDDAHLVTVLGRQRLTPAAAAAFARLQERARAAGFDLAIASAHRDYRRQVRIWNAKLSGERPVHDDSGADVAMDALTPAGRIEAVLRFSALPGTSRHHWGTDLDVYDAAAVPADYDVGLTPEEVAPGGPFAGLHDWLDEQMARGESCGFYRPYAEDRGGVAPERWHLSYAPESLPLQRALTPALVAACWQAQSQEEQPLEMERLLFDLPALMRRYVEVGAGWCPAA